MKFSVMKDKANGDFVVFFQAKDTKMIDLAFRQVFLKAKEISKPSIIQAIKHYKQQAQSHQRQKQQEIGKDTRVKLPSKDKHLER
ncbi:PcfB family protein [Aerococcaceae bacterium NML160702]|nr:PcfB family protein [Aerococcaceae bacterium NML160702]